MKFGKYMKGIGMNDLLGYVMLFVVAGVMLGIGAYITSSVSKSIATAVGTSGSYAENATNQSTLGIYTIASWMPILAIVVIAAVVLGVLIGALYFGVSKHQGV